MFKLLQLVLIKNSRFLLAAVGFFLAGAVTGFLFLFFQPNQSSEIFLQILQTSRLDNIIKRLAKANFIEQFVFIYFNNLKSLLLCLLGGVVLGLVPVLVLFFNGALLGMVAYMFLHSPLLLIKGLVPHGIIELPCLILAGAWGLRLAWWPFAGKARHWSFLKQTLKQTQILILILAGLLLFASLIEVGFTANLL